MSGDTKPNCEYAIHLLQNQEPAYQRLEQINENTKWFNTVVKSVMVAHESFSKTIGKTLNKVKPVPYPGIMTLPSEEVKSSIANLQKINNEFVGRMGKNVVSPSEAQMARGNKDVRKTKADIIRFNRVLEGCKAERDKMDVGFAVKTARLEAEMAKIEGDHKKVEHFRTVLAKEEANHKKAVAKNTTKELDARKSLNRTISGIEDLDWNLLTTLKGNIVRFSQELDAYAVGMKSVNAALETKAGRIDIAGSMKGFINMVKSNNSKEKADLIIEKTVLAKSDMSPRPAAPAAPAATAAPVQLVEPAELAEPAEAPTQVGHL